MPITIFDFVLASPFVRRRGEPQDMSFLTQTEIRELIRMRAEVREARAKVNLAVSVNRMGAM